MTFAVPDQNFEERGCEVEIDRRYRDEREARLIQRAESIAPPRVEVLASIGGPRKQKELGVSYQEPLWWYDVEDGVRIPYAVTSDALSYYERRCKTFRARSRSPTGISIDSVDSQYEAWVRHARRFEVEGRTFKNVDVVHLTLGWSQYYDNRGGMSLFKGRIVVFDRAGEVLGVFLDGDETPIGIIN